MRQASVLRQRLTALGLLGAGLLSYPLVAVPQGDVAGLPLVFLYLFGAWGVLIGLAAWLAERGGH